MDRLKINAALTIQVQDFNDVRRKMMVSISMPFPPPRGVTDLAHIWAYQDILVQT